MDNRDYAEKLASQQTFSRRRVKLPDGTTVPQLGQGTWMLGETPKKRAQEKEALATGLDLGMAVIDTAEMYGNGKAEELVGEVIKGRREQAFLVSKVLPQNAGSKKIIRACEGSLKRLGTDHLDLYLLHWRGRVPLAETVAGMEQLKKEGKIRRWGVSNFDVTDMEELMRVEQGANCQINQVLYHLGSRGIEYDLMPWQKEYGIPIMAYSPLANSGRERERLIRNTAVQEAADHYSADPVQILLAWSMRDPNVLTIPRTSNPEHVQQNAQAASIQLLPEDLSRLDQAFPPPKKKQPLDLL